VRPESAEFTEPTPRSNVPATQFGWATLAAVTDRQERAMSFGSIAEDYDGLRPQAPQQAVDWLVPSGCAVAVDVGAGTGLFTRTLVDRAAQVSALCWRADRVARSGQR
jgi:hypothetical protein